jgi:hypothetical protein
VAGLGLVIFALGLLTTGRRARDSAHRAAARFDGEQSGGPTRPVIGG